MMMTIKTRLYGVPPAATEYHCPITSGVKNGVGLHVTHSSPSCEEAFLNWKGFVMMETNNTDAASQVSSHHFVSNTSFDWICRMQGAYMIIQRQEVPELRRPAVKLHRDGHPRTVFTYFLWILTGIFRKPDSITVFVSARTQIANVFCAICHKETWDCYLRNHDEGLLRYIQLDVSVTRSEEAANTI